MTINWDEAPEGATHYATDPHLHNRWLKENPPSHWVAGHWIEYQNAPKGRRDIAAAEPKPTPPPKKVTFTDAKVGDRVWSLTMGWGVVKARLAPHTTYPLIVEFEDGGYRTYTLWGLLLFTDLNPTLFWDEVKIETPEKSLPDLEVDAKVFVWKDRGNRAYRHFSHFDHRGVMYTFADGRTSFSGFGGTVPWDNWECVNED